MLRLKINDLNGNVLGYEFLKETDAVYRTDITVSDEELDVLRKAVVENNVYYLDGALIIGEPDVYQGKLQQCKIQVAETAEAVKTEYKILMDNLISGMTMEEATAISKANRDMLERYEAQYQEIIDGHERELFNHHSAKNRQAESGMSWKYYSAAVLLIRDENRYLQEWINWHLDVGFDHLYIYDNGVTESVTDVIPEAVEDKITVIPWHGEFQNVQEDAYNHFLRNHGVEVRWANFIDSDEFVRFLDREMTINDFLKSCEDYTVVYAGFVEYNASGQESYSDAPIRERFTETTDVNAHLYHKDFVQVHRIDFMDRHYPRFGERGNYTFKNEQGNKDLIVIDHYYTKSWEEWQEKIARGSSDPKYLKQLNEFFVYNPDMTYLKAENQIQQYRN